MNTHLFVKVFESSAFKISSRFACSKHDRGVCGDVATGDEGRI